MFTPLQSGNTVPPILLISLCPQPVAPSIKSHHHNLSANDRDALLFQHYYLFFSLFNYVFFFLYTLESTSTSYTPLIGFSFAQQHISAAMCHTRIFFIWSTVSVFMNKPGVCVRVCHPIIMEMNGARVPTTYPAHFFDPLSLSLSLLLRKVCVLLPPAMFRRSYFSCGKIQH